MYREMHLGTSARTLNRMGDLSTKSWNRTIKVFKRKSSWSIKSLKNRDQKIIEELKVEAMCTIRNKKERYLIVYNGLDKEKRAAARVGIPI